MTKTMFILDLLTILTTSWPLVILIMFFFSKWNIFRLMNTIGFYYQEKLKKTL